MKHGSRLEICLGGPPVTWRLPPANQASRAFTQCGVLVIDHSLLRSDATCLEARAAAAIERFGTRVTRTGGLDYHVLPGDAVQERLQILTRNPSVSASTHLRSSVNVNCLRRGQAYPWHRDAVPYSAVLCLNSLRTAAGGEFLIERIDGITQNIRCVPGRLVVFDGSRCRHSVAPLKCDTVRLTIPMVFPTNDAERPRGLDSYLYG
jgi:hypothetical protein